MSTPASKPQTVYDVWKPPEQRPLRQLPGLLGSSLSLLCGLYSPSSGRVVRDETDTALVEPATHEEPMQLNGQYADLSTLQAAAYQSDGQAAGAAEQPEAVP